MSEHEGIVDAVAEAIFARHAVGQDFSPNLRDHSLHAQTYWEAQADAAISCVESAGVLGFVAQCDCGQQAIVATQPVPGWVCPRCADAADLCITVKRWMPSDALLGGFGDVDVAAAEPDDEWPVREVRG